jgi:hypothetical protein
MRVVADRLSLRWYLGYLRFVSSKPVTLAATGG